MLRRTTGLALPAAAVLVITWTCGGKSPAEPTPVPTTCTFSVSPASLAFGAAGGSASVTVATAAQCAWSAASDRGWMTVSSGANGTGPGSVAVTLAANAGSSARTGTLTVAGQAIPVQQDGAPACSITVSPAAAAYTKDSATGTFTVTAPSSCAWSVTSGDSWITIASGATGTGTGIVAYAVARNTSAAPRTGSIRAGDALVAISQQGDGGTCTFQVVPVTLNACMAVPYELAVAVSTQSACAWTATSEMPWIAIGGASSRSGPGELRFRIGDNYDAPRLGVLKLRWETPTAGQNVQIAQAGCRYAVSTSTMTVPAGGGTFSFDVYQQSDPLECGGPLQDRCVWTAKSDASWLTVTTAMPRAGDDRVSFTAAANSGLSRVATITVRDKNVVVTQAGR